MFPIVFGIRVLSRSVTPHNAAVLGRDQVQIRLAENGGDSTQDRCAFHVNDLDALFDEFRSHGLQEEISQFEVERHDAPRGRCSRGRA
jgi:lactoylglutathione lyase